MDKTERGMTTMKFEMPEINVEKFEIADVITVSSGNNNDDQLPEF